MPRCVTKDITRRRPKSKRPLGETPAIQARKVPEWMRVMIALVIFIVWTVHLTRFMELFLSKQSQSP